MSIVGVCFLEQATMEGKRRRCLFVITMNKYCQKLLWARKPKDRLFYGSGWSALGFCVYKRVNRNGPRSDLGLGGRSVRWSLCFKIRSASRNRP